jgi:hypothetical protein
MSNLRSFLFALSLAFCLPMLVGTTAIAGVPNQCQAKKVKTADEVEIENLIDMLSRIEQQQSNMSMYYRRLGEATEPSILLNLDEYDKFVKYRERVYREIYEEFFGTKKPDPRKK